MIENVYANSKQKLSGLEKKQGFGSKKSRKLVLSESATVFLCRKRRLHHMKRRNDRQIIQKGLKEWAQKDWVWFT